MVEVKYIPLSLNKGSTDNKNRIDLEKISGEVVCTYLKDGDEFIFKLTSFDKWVKVIETFNLYSNIFLLFKSIFVFNR